jgi:8-oxo-dGTP pyrophosphatase MutT (NUDIX family)
MSVPVHDAVTVALLRDGEAGIETWLLTRVRQMVFAAGMSVFPGGRVEEVDAAAPVPARAISLTASRFGCPAAMARSLLGAGVRETEEETGVRFADPSALRPYARWVTPEHAPRRYDTRFFLAALPAGAQPANVTTESSVSAWVPVARALEEVEARSRLMLPPTIVTCGWLAQHDCVAAALAAADAEPIHVERPSVVMTDGRSVTTLSDGRRIEVWRELA